MRGCRHTVTLDYHNAAGALVRDCQWCGEMLPLGQANDDDWNADVESCALDRVPWASGLTPELRDEVLNSGKMCVVGCVYCEAAYLACFMVEDGAVPDAKQHGGG